MRFHGKILAPTLAAALLMATACAPMTANLATTTTPQVTSLEGAVAASAAAKRTATVYVQTHSLTQAQLNSLDALRAAEEAVLAQLEDDQAHGRSLVFDTFTAALSALQKAAPAN